MDSDSTAPSSAYTQQLPWSTLGWPGIERQARFARALAGAGGGGGGWG